MNIASHWTDDRIEELKELWKTKSATEIAAKFGVTRNSVVGKLHRLGLGNNDKSKDHAQARLNGQKPRRKPKQKPALRIVSNGAGTGLRIMETVIGELPSFSCCEVVSRELTIDQLGPDDCRYLTDGDNLQRYCGNPVFKRSYCAGHFARCYESPKPHQKAAQPTWRAA
jgi:hypothetical protein